MIRQIGIRTVWLDNGLHYYEVAHVTFEPTDIDFLTDMTFRVIDCHWQESTARLCAQRWAEHYKCGLAELPLQPMRGTVDLS